jgi:hypothetical protein
MIIPVAAMEVAPPGRRYVMKQSNLNTSNTPSLEMLITMPRLS